MMRKPNHEDSTSNDVGEESGTPHVGRWSRFRDLLSKSRGKKARYPEDRPIDESAERHITSRPSKLRPPISLKHKTEMNETANGFGDGTISLRSLKKTKTFSNIFGIRKAKTIADLAESPQSEFEQQQMRLKTQPSPNQSINQNAPDEEPTIESQKLDRLRWVRESDANRTMIFKGDLPPLSPLSTKHLHSGETEKSRSRRSDASETEDEKSEKNETKEQDNETLDTSHVPGVEPKRERNSKTRFNNPNLRKTLLNMRVGSIVVDEARLSSRLRSSPLTSPRRMHRRTSSLPGYLGHSVERSSSAPGEIKEGTKQAISDDLESPWGVKGTSETEGEAETGTSSRSFRVIDLVQGFKSRRQTQSSSVNLSLTDDDESQEGDGNAEPVDMFEDDFVDYSVRHIQKAQGQRTLRARTRKGIQNFTQAH